MTGSGDVGVWSRSGTSPRRHASTVCSRPRRTSTVLADKSRNSLDQVQKQIRSEKPDTLARESQFRAELQLKREATTVLSNDLAEAERSPIVKDAELTAVRDELRASNAAVAASRRGVRVMIVVAVVRANANRRQAARRTECRETS